MLALLLSGCLGAAGASAANPTPQKAPASTSSRQPSPDPAPQAEVKPSTSHTSTPTAPAVRRPVAVSSSPARPTPRRRPGHGWSSSRRRRPRPARLRLRRGCRQGRTYSDPHDRRSPLAGDARRLAADHVHSVPARVAKGSAATTASRPQLRNRRPSQRRAVAAQRRGDGSPRARKPHAVAATQEARAAMRRVALVVTLAAVGVMLMGASVAWGDPVALCNGRPCIQEAWYTSRSLSPGPGGRHGERLAAPLRNGVTDTNLTYCRTSPCRTGLPGRIATTPPQAT